MLPSVSRVSAGDIRRAFHFGVGLVVLSCKTPPPLPHTASAAPTVAAEPEPGPPSPPTAAKAGRTSERRPPPAPSRNPRELEATYRGRSARRVLRGEASYYGAAFAGRKTASGEVFDPALPTAAHRTLPFGTVLRVIRIDTGAVVYVRVNDRGPFGKSRRILDLSTSAAEQLGMLRRGVAEVRAEVLELGPKKSKKKKKARHQVH